MSTELLQKIGLNKSEAKVYLTLLEIGSSTTGPLMNKARISSSKIYGILERLIEKGLVSFIIRAKTKYYQASPPETLLEYLQEKEEQLQQQEREVKKLIEELKYKEFPAEKQEARIFLGWKGVQNAYNFVLQVLPPGSDFIGFVQPTIEEQRKAVKLFYMQYHRKRMSKRYNTKLIATAQSRRIFKQEPYTSFKRFRVKYVDNCPSGLVIFGNYILLIAFEENPVAVIIHSRQIAASYRKLFESMWRNS